LIKHGCNVYFHFRITCLYVRARTHPHTHRIHTTARAGFLHYSGHFKKMQSRENIFDNNSNPLN